MYSPIGRLGSNNKFRERMVGWLRIAMTLATGSTLRTRLVSSLPPACRLPCRQSATVSPPRALEEARVLTLVLDRHRVRVRGLAQAAVVAVAVQPL